MKKQIAVSKADREFLAKLFKVTVRTVFNALSTKYEDNDLHKRIRKAAMNRGGVVMVTLPAMETFHDADGIMRQYMPNGAILEFSKKDGSGHVYFNGKEISTYENVTIPMIYEIQERAAALR